MTAQLNFGMPMSTDLPYVGFRFTFTRQIHPKGCVSYSNKMKCRLIPKFKFTNEKQGQIQDFRTGWCR